MDINQAFKTRKYQEVLLAAFQGCKTLLDVGAGYGQAHRRLQGLIPVRVGVEIYRPYLEQGEFPPDSIMINADIADLRELFIDKSFDAVLISDVLEHFDKDEAYDVLKNCQALCRKSLLIWIPWGEHPQTYDDTGMDNHYHQTHKSYWEPKELEDLGYKTAVWENYHKPSPLKPSIDQRAGFAYRRFD